MFLHSYQSLIWNEMVTRRIELFGKEPVVGDLVLNQDGKPVILEAQQVKEYTIDDVVLPLPGFDVIYPSHSIGDLFKERLSKDGLTSASFDKKDR